ncbi:MAG: hypothetical protein OEU09_12900 [Rhodospirillales bacterium]|nr:hypothetical protein [Rhodospirillales bacterium]MDH3792732.1 hypothetical protein [Rhodospirillales bacterium]MDH3912186.1 hypothetical protein [Rhodospirillales bacterium]MDH3918645.1 hypothetical protein [Rhodospirillales bacterium]MDH3968527.1 hypothetical protein [Rhodospirillales bacterium]
MTAWRTLGVLLALAVIAAALVACGKRSAPKAPEGQESEYSYPRPYPAPKSVLPRGASAAEEEEAEAEAKAAAEAEAEEKRRGLRKLSPIPPSSSRTKTTTYGTLPE